MQGDAAGIHKTDVGFIEVSIDPGLGHVSQLAFVGGLRPLPASAWRSMSSVIDVHGQRLLGFFYGCLEVGYVGSLVRMVLVWIDETDFRLPDSNDIAIV